MSLISNELLILPNRQRHAARLGRQDGRALVFNLLAGNEKPAVIWAARFVQNFALAFILEISKVAVLVVRNQGVERSVEGSKVMNKHALALLVAGASALTVTVNSASADIAIGLSESINGTEGTIFTVATSASPPNALVASGTFGPDGASTQPGGCPVGGNCSDFTFLTTGVGSPPLGLPALFNTSDSNVVANAGGVSTIGNIITLNVYVTSSFNTLPTGSNIFGNTLTVNNQAAGVVTTLAAFEDNNNGIFSTSGAGVTSLGDHTFLGGISADTFGPILTTIALTTPYSITTRYAFSANNVGDSSNMTIDVTVPGPIAGAGLPGIIAGCIGLIGLARRRRQKTA